MKKRIFILTVVFIVCGVLIGVGFLKMSKKKSVVCTDCNVILISVDSLRADHIGAFGYKRDTTPNFDKFAQSSTLFLNYFSTSFLTPVSEMSVQTGLYPTSHGVTNFDTILPENKLTIAEYLKGKSYETSALSSSPEFEINPALKKSFSRGFDRYQYFIDTSKQQDKFQQERQFFHQADVNSELDTLKDKKFFLWLAVGGVHWPYDKGFQNIYADKNYSGVFFNKMLDWEGFQYIYKRQIYKEINLLGDQDLQDADIQYVIDNYDNGIRAFDDFLGQLMRELKQRGLLEKTIVIIESEHGEDLGEHGYFAHYDVLDTQVHVPLLVFTPSLQNGKKISSLSSGVDVFPTIVELLGGVVSDGIQGKSLVPIMDGKEKNGIRTEIFIERSPLWEEAISSIRWILEGRGIKVISGQYKDIAIRTSEWKYILRLSQKRMEEVSWWKTLTGQPMNIPEAELYNIIDDPLETQNVIDKYPKEGEILRKKLEDWFAGISSAAPAHIDTEGTIQPYF